MSKLLTVDRVIATLMLICVVLMSFYIDYHNSHNVKLRTLPIECRSFDPDLIYAIKQIESNMNPNAKGDGNTSYGLMQIKYSTAKHIGYKGKPNGLLDPQTNMKWGCLYLSKMLERTGDINRALAAYNMGPNAEKKNQYIGKWEEHPYVGKIKKIWDKDK